MAHNGHSFMKHDWTINICSSLHICKESNDALKEIGGVKNVKKASVHINTV